MTLEEDAQAGQCVGNAIDDVTCIVSLVIMQPSLEFHIESDLHRPPN